MDYQDDKVVEKLQNWSLDEGAVQEDQDAGNEKLTSEETNRFHTEYANEYLELSDDENNQSAEEKFRGIDTIGLNDEDDNEVDLDDGETGASPDLERNPWDGLSYSSQYYELLSERQQLSIWKAKDDFVLSVDESPIVLVTGKAGSGKSTQIPQWCAYFAKELRFQFGTVVCTQPHALAAISLSMQVSREMDLTSIGNEVGYKVPFSDCTSDETFLKFCTDEVLLREMTEDPLLERYGIIILDEVQERTISTDVLLSLLKIISCHRDTLKIVVISQSHAMPKLEEYFEGVPIVDLTFMEENADQNDAVKNDQEPTKIVEKTEQSCKIHYKLMNILGSDFVSDAVEIIMKCHCDQNIEGNILVFMPGKKEIDEICERVAREVAMRALRCEAGDLVVAALYHELPYGFQQKVYEKSENTSISNENGLRPRKLIVCDSIAESSFSMSNISVVVDSGRLNSKVYNCRIRAHSDFLTYTTKLNVNMRTSRCAKTGQVYRLYTEAEFKKFEEFPLPAVVRSELSTNILLMKRLLQRLDVAFSSCHTLDPPGPEAYMQALEDLDYHGALDDNGNLSDLGAVMSEFPLSLQLAKCVIASCGELCSEEMLSIVSMLVVPDFFVVQDGMQTKIEKRRKMMTHSSGDHFTLLNIYDAFIANKESEQWCKDNFLRYSSLKLATQVRANIVQVMERLELPMSPRLTDMKEMEISVKKALLAGFFMQVAKDVDGSGNYLIVRDRHVARLSSASFSMTSPEWVTFNRFVLSDNSYIVTVSSVTPEMVAEIMPQSYLANLPSGEAKSNLLEAIEKLKHANIRDKELAGESVETAKDIEKSSMKLPLHRQQGIPAAPSSQYQNKKGNSHSIQGTRPYSSQAKSSTSTDSQIQKSGNVEVDILTQTARDLNYMYQQASSYVRNYATEETEEEEESCNIQ
ncbi:putative pre-mRNA-splicing factor ATP-dependent RNA helicase DHX32 isoform X1 [Styela clava]